MCHQRAPKRRHVAKKRGSNPHLFGAVWAISDLETEYLRLPRIRDHFKNVVGRSMPYIRAKYKMWRLVVTNHLVVMGFSRNWPLDPKINTAVFLRCSTFSNRFIPCLRLTKIPACVCVCSPDQTADVL